MNVHSSSFCIPSDGRTGEGNVSQNSKIETEPEKLSFVLAVGGRESFKRNANLGVGSNKDEILIVLTIGSHINYDLMLLCFPALHN